MSNILINQRNLLLVGSWLFLSDLAHGAQPTLSQQLLDSYFKTAGVCTTSQVEHIEDAGALVEITISIEALTAKALLNMSQPDRNDWFSLHCPPEIHGVWHQQNPPDDIQVTGTLGEGQQHTLSCVQYQQDQYSRQSQRQSSMKDKIEKWLADRLK